MHELVPTNALWSCSENMLEICPQSDFSMHFNLLFKGRDCSICSNYSKYLYMTKMDYLLTCFRSGYSVTGRHSCWRCD